MALPRSYIYAESGWDNAVGVTTTLLAGLYGDWIPLGLRFSAPLQPDPEPRSAPCTIATGSDSEVKWVGRGAGQPHLYSV